ncbi:MAG TPA: hypothetical protein VGM83_16760 [Devosiaceae bacterium]|jgi:hypothetical protein
MASVLYLVLKSREKWWVDMEGKSLGPFDTVEVATFAAIDAAGAVYHFGQDMRVYAERPNRKFELVWSSLRGRGTGEEAPKSA